MVKPLPNLLIFFVLIPAWIQSASFTTEKIITREFPIAAEGTLIISSFESNIDIVIGPSGTVKFKIVITAPNDRLSDAEILTSHANVIFENEASQITASRLATSKDASTLSSKNTSIPSIHFFISVPPDISLRLTNTQGDIYIETANRSTVIDMKDGRLSLGDINGNLTLNMLRSTGRISQIHDGTYTLTESNLEMEDAHDVIAKLDNTVFKSGSVQHLELNTTSSTINVLSADQISYNGKDDVIEIESAGTISAKSKSSYIILNELTGESEFVLHHGQLSIYEVFPVISALTVMAAYTNVELQLNPIISYAVSVDLQHGQIEHDEIRVVKNLVKKGRHFFKAIKGSGQSAIDVNMRYGTLKLEFN